MLLFQKKEYQRLLNIFKLIDKDQFWFWTKEWQKKEKQADRDIKQKKLWSFKDLYFKTHRHS